MVSWPFTGRALEYMYGSSKCCAFFKSKWASQGCLYWIKVNWMPMISKITGLPSNTTTFLLEEFSRHKKFLSLNLIGAVFAAALQNYLV